MQDINLNRERYLKLLAFLQSSGKADGNGLATLLDKTDFFLAPATTKYYGSEDGGLCYHSLQVCYMLIKLADTFGYREKFSDATLVTLGLVHELGKVNYYEKTSVNQKVYSENGTKFDELGKFDWVASIGYKVIPSDERRPLGNFGFKSYLMSKNYINYTEDEIVALCNYQEIADQSSRVEILTMMKQNPLMTLLYLADLSVTYLEVDCDLSFYD